MTQTTVNRMGKGLHFRTFLICNPLTANQLIFNNTKRTLLIGSLVTPGGFEPPTLRAEI